MSTGTCKTRRNMENICSEGVNVRSGGCPAYTDQDSCSGPNSPPGVGSDDKCCRWVSSSGGGSSSSQCCAKVGEDSVVQSMCSEKNQNDCEQDNNVCVWTQGDCPSTDDNNIGCPDVNGNYDCKNCADLARADGGCEGHRSPESCCSNKGCDYDQDSSACITPGGTPQTDPGVTGQQIFCNYCWDKNPNPNKRRNPNQSLDRCCKKNCESSGSTNIETCQSECVQGVASCGDVTPSDMPCDQFKCTSDECCRDTMCGGSGVGRSCPIGCTLSSGAGSECVFGSGGEVDPEDVTQGSCTTGTVVCRTQPTGGSPCAEISHMGCLNNTTEPCFFPVGETAVEVCNQYYSQRNGGGGGGGDEDDCVDTWISVLDYCLELPSEWDNTYYDIFLNFVKNLIATFGTSDASSQTNNSRVRSTFSTDSDKIATVIVNNICNPKGEEYSSSPKNIGSSENEIVSVIKDLYNMYNDGDLSDPGKPSFDGGDTPKPAPTPSASSSSDNLLMWGLIGGLAFVLLILLIVYFLRRRGNKSPPPSTTSQPAVLEPVYYGPSLGDSSSSYSSIEP